MKVIGKRDDGTLLGEGEDGTLYQGTQRKVPLDEIAIENVVSQDGDVIDRTERVGDHVLARSHMERAAFFASHKDRLKRGYASAGASEADAEAAAQAAVSGMWQAEKTVQRHAKDYTRMVNANGDVVTVEVTKTVIDWTVL